MDNDSGKSVNNEIELWEQWIGLELSPTRNLDAARRMLTKWIYKGTTCGAGITFESDSILIGSIVEGVEQTTTYYRLEYPFDIQQFNETLDKIEQEALDIWNETHGCEQCGDEDPYTGYIRVNPHCQACGGYGTVI